MKRLIIVGFTVLSSLFLLSCTAKDAQPEVGIEESPTVTKTSEAVVEIMATKTLTPLPTETPLPTATSTPEREAEVELLETASYFDQANDFNVIGLIKNVGAVPIEDVGITVTVHDASGTVVATRETFSYLDVVFPGETAPFIAYFFDDIPADVSYEVEVDAEVASEFMLNLNYREFEILSAEGGLSDSGYSYSILGEVHNTGEKVAESVSIHALLFNSEGALIGYATTVTKYAILSAGSTSPFEFLWLKENLVEFKVDHFELIVEGMVSEQPSVKEPTPESEEVFKLVDVNGFPDLLGFRVVGLLQNISDHDLDMVSVIINLRDTDGKIIASDSALTLIFRVLAGEVVPFEIRFSDIPDAEIGSIEAAAQGQLASPTSRMTRALEIVTAEGEINEFGHYSIKGEIKNISKTDVENIDLNVAIFDAEGRILGVGLGFLDTTSLAVGETTGFEISISYFAEGEVDHFEFYVEGYEVEEG
jgi:hypothetical protein